MGWIDSTWESITEHPIITGIVIMGTGTIAAVAPPAFIGYMDQREINRINEEYDRAIKEAETLPEGEERDKKLKEAEDKKREKLEKLSKIIEERLKWTRWLESKLFFNTMNNLRNDIRNYNNKAVVEEDIPLGELDIHTVMNVLENNNYDRSRRRKARKRISQTLANKVPLDPKLEGETRERALSLLENTKNEVEESEEEREKKEDKE
jgi:hypothetical protein